MEQQDTYYISNAIKNWLKRNKTQLIIAFVLLCLGIFALNQYISIIYKVELLFQPCELCQQAGYECRKFLPINLTG